jgi:hypothetical protein
MATQGGSSQAKLIVERFQISSGWKMDWKEELAF